MSNDDSSETLSERRQQYGGRPTTTKDDAREVPGINGKYSGLSRLATHYNRQFSEQQHHAYGCNCMMIGDRPMLQEWLADSPNLFVFELYSISRKRHHSVRQLMPLMQHAKN